MHRPLPPFAAAALLALAALFASSARAHDYAQGAIRIEHPYARATAGGQRTGGAYLALVNGGAAGDRLVAASTEVAAATELHEMRMEGDVMRMRQLDAIELPAASRVELAPGRLHLMLVGLKSPLKAGDRFPMTLRFEKAGELTVQVHVEAPAAAAASRPAPHAHH